MLLKKGKRRPSSSHKIMELMHVIKRRLSYTVCNSIVRTYSKPLARVHPGYVLSVLCPLAQNKNDAVTLIPLGKNTSRKERLNKIVSGLKKQGWTLKD